MASALFFWLNLQTLHPLALPGAVPPAWSAQASRKELLQRAAAAQSDVREERLRRCVEEAERQNFVQAAWSRYTHSYRCKHESKVHREVMHECEPIDILLKRIDR